MRKAFIILGNGFTIDFLQYYSKVDSSINEKIDCTCNIPVSFLATSRFVFGYR